MAIVRPINADNLFCRQSFGDNNRHCCNKVTKPDLAKAHIVRSNENYSKYIQYNRSWGI